VWWAGSRVHDVYLGTRGVAVCLGGQVLLARSAEGFDGALAFFNEWLETERKRPRLRIWFSGGVCRPFIVPAVEGVKANAERMKIARALAPQQTGLSGDCQVWLERRSADEAFVAVAIERARLTQFEKVVASSMHKVQVVSARPWWGEVLQHARGCDPALAALGIQDCDSMTVLVGRGDTYELASTYSPITNEDAGRAALTRALVAGDGNEGEVTIARLVCENPPVGERARDVALGALAVFSR
jgi:hypothetical protein